MKNEFMKRAIGLSIESVNKGGGPFGCVIVKNGKIVSEGSNKVTSTNDPQRMVKLLLYVTHVKN
jgi:tRNA(Arg) A34 adenosine deaminase TadA